MGADEPRFRVLHVSNISMSATKEQIYQLFAFIGRIDEFKMYPTDTHPQLSTFSQKFAYVKFEESKSVEVAQHLTNTVFIDRALVCIPSISDVVPDEETALKTGGPAWPGQRQLPPNVVNQVQDLGDGQQMSVVSVSCDHTTQHHQMQAHTMVVAKSSGVTCNYFPALTVPHFNFDPSKDALCTVCLLLIFDERLFEFQLLTVDPTLTALGLPPYPALSANTDASKVEEIRRTIYVGNLPKECDPQEVMQFFNDNIGEVMYLRMASGNENLQCGYAYVEFTNQPTVPIALQNNGIEFKGRCLRIQHSRVAIIKPEHKTADMALQEVEEAIRVNQNPEKSSSALNKLNQGIDRAYSPLRRSVSPIRRRSRSRDRRRRSRSRSRRRRSRSRSRDRRSRSRERRRRSRSRDRDRRRSRSKDRKDKDKDRHTKDKDRGKDKEREKERKDRKRSRSRTPKKKDDKDKFVQLQDRRKEKESERKRDKDKGREKEKEKKRESKVEKSRREKVADKKSSKDREKDRDREREGDEEIRRKSESNNTKTTTATSSTTKADVKLQIEDGEGMEVDAVTPSTTNEESRMRERLLEKVMARNGGGSSNEQSGASSKTYEKQNGKEKELDKREGNNDEKSPEQKKKRPTVSSSSSSDSSSSDSD
ncbi:unnamed protein product [Anisakis simplex]|uniref:Probable splicing factor, arginine/serine-rich 7 (inferred by orthology to a C. elegans protein) n=1 Tax=Anisakis simplex TaxID=6269 RepID=A0A158PP17_ANISI|nr:unnamed protein product [Anisakis simplex]